MPITPHWFLPTNGDSRSDRSLGNAVGGEGSRVVDADGWVMAAALSQVTERFRFLAGCLPRRLLDRRTRPGMGAIDEFILSGYRHREEAYQVGEGVLPILGRRGLLAPATPEPETLEV